MLRHIIDVTVGLVNGAIGTLMGIYGTHISIKFDDIDKPCDIKRVTSRFMLSRNLYMGRKQFLLIVSYANTIYNYHGLSRHSTIIDLLTNVFWGWYGICCIVSFSNLCINEIDHLRTKF
uniref:Uncharacterized protein n=1 Tax=Amphimedon queenslandica TaxID=400682 RepID=A0A1X7V6R8_AMPQE